MLSVGALTGTLGFPTADVKLAVRIFPGPFIPHANGLAARQMA
jgi:hypothetical protein